MRKLFKVYSIRNLMLQFPKQNYSVYRHLHRKTIPPLKVLSSGKVYYSVSTISAPQDVTESIGVLELHKEFQEPKKILFQVLNEAFLRDQNLDLKPSIVTEQISTDSSNEHMWKASMQMKWPEVFETEGLASRKADAINICLLQACQKLKQLGVLDNTNKPLLQQRKYNEHDMKSAKGDLINLCQKIWHRYGDKQCMPQFNTKLIRGLYGDYWQAELHLSYPEKKVFEAVSHRSSNAECIAAYDALLWLSNKGIINKKRRLVEHTKSDEMRLKESHEAPYSVCIPPDVQDKMQSVLTAIAEQKSFLSFKNNNECVNSMEKESNKDFIMRDIITENSYYKLTDQQFYDRSRYLYEKNKSLERRDIEALDDIKEAKSILPVFQKREDILKLIEENQVVILSGDTGSGKSTQVPQIILDHYISNMKGAGCNILVTQPRRLSAISLADRVAKERGEKVGHTVGHRIRLSKILPQGNGAILYCTTGMLLRKIVSNPDMQGISHVIIDEIHERNIQIDLMLILLKDLLEKNKSIKLVLMSASFNTNLFANYFSTSAVMHVPGKMYPVEEYYLEDLVDVIPSVKNRDERDVMLNPDIVVDAINHINENEPSGAILCFLPGWQEIKTVHSKLFEKQESGKFVLYPVHSKLSHEEQKKIFCKPPVGQRKVILATNIAETSITIDDVAYVIDSGIHKGTLLDMKVGIASLSTQWITKANVRQRKGRAGRVKPGKCYHLFSWKTFMKMEEYPIPEILRISLEKVILDCKLYCPGSKAEEFLSKGLQTPAAAAIQCGIKELQTLGILNENEDLTYLGDVVVHFSTHPRLSVALIYAAFLRCLDPVLTICAILTTEREPFINTLDDKLQIRKIKEMHDNGLCSDHLALTKMYDSWNSLTEEADKSEYIEKNLLDHQILVNIKQLKELFADDLCISGLIPDASSFGDKSSVFNTYSSHVPSIFAALTAAFSPNVIKVLQGEISQGKLNKNALVYSIIKGQKAFIQRESIVSDVDELPTPWLIYFSALKSEARRKAMVSAVSTIPGICLLLLAGKDLTMTNAVKQNSPENLTILSVNDYSKLNFSCTEKEARLLLDWRECLLEIFNLHIRNLRVNSEEREYVISFHERLLPVLKELFETPQVPFTKGQHYEFVNNELIANEM